MELRGLNLIRAVGLQLLTNAERIWCLFCSVPLAQPQFKDQGDVKVVPGAYLWCKMKLQILLTYHSEKGKYEVIFHCSLKQSLRK